jgi:hypothetical protein
VFSPIVQASFAAEMEQPASTPPVLSFAAGVGGALADGSAQPTSNNLIARSKENIVPAKKNKGAQSCHVINDILTA